MAEISSRIVFYWFRRQHRLAAELGGAAFVLLALVLFWGMAFPGFKAKFDDPISPIFVGLIGAGALVSCYAACILVFESRIAIDENGIAELWLGFPPKKLAWNRIQAIDDRSPSGWLILQGSAGDATVRIPTFTYSFAPMIEQIMRRCPDAVNKVASLKKDFEVPLIVHGRDGKPILIRDIVLSLVNVLLVIFVLGFPVVSGITLGIVFLAISVLYAFQQSTLVVTRDRLIWKTLLQTREIPYSDIDDVIAFAPYLEDASIPVGPFMQLYLQLRSQRTLVLLPFEFPYGVIQSKLFLRSLVQQWRDQCENVIVLQTPVNATHGLNAR